MTQAEYASALRVGMEEHRWYKARKWLYPYEESSRALHVVLYLYSGRAKLWKSFIIKSSLCFFTFIGIETIASCHCARESRSKKVMCLQPFLTSTFACSHRTVQYPAIMDPLSLHLIN